MKTKSQIIRFVGALVLSLLNSCGEPVQKFKVAVVDELNTPMMGVEVAAWFNKRGEASSMDSYKVTGRTNSQGTVEIEGETIWYRTSVEAHPAGYYISTKSDHWTKSRKGNQWEPWPVEVKLVMKKIHDPHPMYVARTKDKMSFKFPTPGTLGPAGFDLELKDWVEPYGRGKVSDFVISGSLANTSEPGYSEKNGRRIVSNAKGTIRLTFSNPDDGIQWFEDNGGSMLAGPAVAPVEGYEKSWDFINWNKEAGQESTTEECYVFRVRTVRNAEGKIVSARYGKIDGKPRGSFGRSSFVDLIYYLNFDINDRRLEWDGKSNLFKDLNIENWPERR